MQYVKNNIEGFDNYFPSKKNKYNFNHVKQRLNISIDQHNKEIISLDPYFNYYL